MNKIYYCPQFPVLTAMELELPQIMSESLLRRELKRLITNESQDQEVPINEAMDLIQLYERPNNLNHLLSDLMQSEEIKKLVMETDGTLMITQDQETTQDDALCFYQDKTFYSFLIDLTNWLEIRE